MNTARLDGWDIAFRKEDGEDLPEVTFSRELSGTSVIVTFPHVENMWLYELFPVVEEDEDTGDLVQVSVKKDTLMALDRVLKSNFGQTLPEYKDINRFFREHLSMDIYEFEDRVKRLRQF